MDNDLLRDVIEVEKEIQRSLENEKQAMRQWLDVRKKEIEGERGRKEKELWDSFQKAGEQAERDARNKASDIIRQAEVQAEWFRRVTDESLSKIISRHISKILPG